MLDVFGSSKINSTSAVIKLEKKKVFVEMYGQEALINIKGQ